jgi:hypothetical protein
VILGYKWRSVEYNIGKEHDQNRRPTLCFNCDNKCNKGHKSGERKLLYIDCEEKENQELEPL